MTRPGGKPTDPRELELARLGAAALVCPVAAAELRRRASERGAT